MTACQRETPPVVQVVAGAPGPTGDSGAPGYDGAKGATGNKEKTGNTVIVVPQR